ncbi:MAG: HAD-IIA family hydrolase [Oscillospiraceae bacterium]|nr:HAD-IIA family hydrolase [Oscillospiraceae bacterium]
MGNLAEKKLFLLDMDGTIYLDEDLFDGTMDFLAHVKKIGGRYLFLTNNSSRSVDAYVQKLGRLGIEAQKEDFLTSTDATILYLKANYPDAKVYAFGTTTFKEQLVQGGIRITDRLEDDIDLLLCGFDTELTFQKLEDSCILLGRGVPFIATNPDWVCPTWYGYVPDCGSVCRMLTTATGREPLFIGKPQPEMALLAMERFGYEKRQTMMIGDRLYTDIASGINAGIDACFVLSGEGTMEDLKTSDVQPTMIYENIRALYEDLKNA